MIIPIFNSIYPKFQKEIKSKSFDINKMNSLNFKEIELKRFPVVRVLSLLSNNCSLFETVIVSANDALVENFLNHKIKFNDISILLFKIVNHLEFRKYKKITPKTVEDIINLKEYVSSKTNLMRV
jgi:1-deoxy-D-xylulose-5-phosphate reductoisomerase